MHIKKGDSVIVIGGKDRGTKGTIEKSFPKTGKVLILGVNVIKKHQKSRTNDGKGQTIEKPMPIDASKVMIVDSKTGKQSRVGHKLVGEKKVRVTKKGGVELK